MNNPLKIMDEIERNRRFFEHGGGRTLESCADWQSLREAIVQLRDEHRTALEAQAEELAQKDARIAHLETQVKGLEFHISTRPPAAALKAEALRDHASRQMQKAKRFEVDDPRGEKHRVAYMLAVEEADRLEREARVIVYPYYEAKEES